MNEQTMIWFLQKSIRHELSRNAMILWMDLYAYLQHLCRACCPQVRFTELRTICDLEQEDLLAACQELENAAMLVLQFQQEHLYCRLVAERLYKAPDTTAG